MVIGGNTVTENEFTLLKRRALSRYFSKLNDMQREAVFTVNGPLLILAGAGSGKTTVLVNRIANMIYFGNAYSERTYPVNLSDEDVRFLKAYADGTETDAGRLKDIIACNCVNPWNILAITFTNKAASELKERLEALLKESAQGITAATFHSACVRILRREIDKLGFERNFTIYDTDDSLRVIKACMSSLDISDKIFQPKMVLSEISHSKESQVGPDEYARLAFGDFRRQKIAAVYAEYQSRLKASGALDFDDIILFTVELFESFPDVLDHYRNLYKYILVDEYQDTNMVQYKLIALLSDKHKNICVVGDDDQSIYKFRGATIENILSFEHQYENAKVIRLEQNYRSTQNILTSANEVIKNNKGRKGKNLWTSSGEGEKVVYYRAETEQGEARFVAETILGFVKNGGKYSQNAVLYRMNAQSNALERAFVASGIDYKVIGGVKFYDRKEIKDIIAYLSVINNENDILRLRRIINEPKRGIGAASVEALESIASGIGESPLQIMRTSADYPMLARASLRLTALAGMFDSLKELAETAPLPELLDRLMSESGYEKYLSEQGDEGTQRLENINELKSTMINYTQNAENPSLEGFLEEISLYTDIDSMDSESDSVTLMTIHSAKGLEFDNVFVVGMEENIFPSSRSLDTEEDIEEERRLAYVAITRAKKRLYLSSASRRMLFGTTSFARPSRFISELPESALKRLSEHSESHADLGRTHEKSDAANSLSAQIERLKTPSASYGQTFNAGDRVSHNVFGEGIVLKATKIANDTMLEIAFDRVGTKKIMAAFAKIRKL